MYKYKPVDKSLRIKPTLESSEDGQQHALQNVKDLSVRVLNLQLNIKTSELGHVSRGVGVLSSENRTDAEHALPASCNLELLVELGRLGQEGLFAKVLESEDVGATLRRCADEAGGFEFLELTGFEVRAEEPLDFNADILYHVNLVSTPTSMLRTIRTAIAC